MRAWKSTDGNNPQIWCVYKKSSDMIEELRQFCENSIPGDRIEYETLEMSEEEFNALPEFEGY